ncbi:MAG: VWA domain-containing protein [Synergistaceae bacterium]|nr:VWA domain-containing protein [Synergistaceae bacterium]
MAGRRGFRTVSSIDHTNPHARLAMLLAIDTSGTMSGSPINELNAGIRLFYETIRISRESKYAADLAIISFGDKGVRRIQDFAQVYQIPNPTPLTASGMTPMGEAVNLALDMIEARLQEYSSLGIQYYHPWLVLMSDGKPNGDVSEFERAASRARDLVERRKLVVFPVGVGKDADRDSLAQFSTRIVPRKLTGMNFREFFGWLSMSTDRVSASKPGEKIDLPQVTWGTDGGWGSI